MGLSAAVGSLTSIAYLYSNPASYGGIWETDARLDASLPVEECACEVRHYMSLFQDQAGVCQRQESAPGINWQELLKDLRDNLREDPSFSRPWVHQFCSSYYASFFNEFSLDEATYQISKKTCGAGLLAIAAVCSQSFALQMANISARWRWTERPVQDEGRSVQDVLEPMPAGDCLRLCEKHAACASVAHGPYGCHLKDKCVLHGDELVLPGVAQGYRTYYQRSGPCINEDPGAPDLDRQHLADVRYLMDSAVRLLDHVVHCLDKSSWPFSIEEVLANRIELIASTLHAQQHGEALQFHWRRWESFKLPFSCNAEARSAVGDAGAVCRTLSRLMIRWVRGLDSEVGFWHALLDPANANNSEVDPEAWKSAQDWVQSGAVTWHYGDICSFLDLARSSDKYGSPRVLNAGSGPLAPGQIECVRSVPVVASDGLARFYLQLFDILQHEPPALPVQCPTESLHECFPQHHFDVAHVRNSLDHANDPMVGILQLIWVVRPGGWVLLRHARNEGVAGHFQLGLHQWAFDVEDAADGSQHFVIWSPSLRLDVSEWLLSSGHASQVKAQRRPHPAGGVEEYVPHAEALPACSAVGKSRAINLTWRWVKKHDRDCIRRGMPQLAASRAAAQSAAAAVTNNALQMAAASAESAKLSSASARTRLHLSVFPKTNPFTTRFEIHRAGPTESGLSAGKALTTLRRRLQGRDAAPVAPPLPEEGGRGRPDRASSEFLFAGLNCFLLCRAERSSDARPATVTKAHDAFKRRSDGVRSALDVTNTLDGKIWEKARMDRELAAILMFAAFGSEQEFLQIGEQREHLPGLSCEGKDSAASAASAASTSSTASTASTASAASDSWKYEAAQRGTAVGATGTC
eukprot:symbB.v1.2.013616.t1/scaffold968.1/size148170/11